MLLFGRFTPETAEHYCCLEENNVETHDLAHRSKTLGCDPPCTHEKCGAIADFGTIRIQVVTVTGGVSYFHAGAFGWIRLAKI